jgi:hypothetical protein
MHPKTHFKDTVDRVEKSCHSKRMHVRLHLLLLALSFTHFACTLQVHLSAWREEATQSDTDMVNIPTRSPSPTIESDGDSDDSYEKVSAPPDKDGWHVIPDSS